MDRDLRSVSHTPQAPNRPARARDRLAQIRRAVSAMGGEPRKKPQKQGLLCRKIQTLSQARLHGRGLSFYSRFTTAENRHVLGGIVMIRSELIQKIADDNPHLYQRDVERIVNTIFDEITGAMSDGDRVELRGFGAFSVKKRDARIGRNPRTGETVHVEEKHVPFFKTGKLLRDRLNGKA